jgi:hypothetical protein
MSLGDLLRRRRHRAGRRLDRARSEEENDPDTPDHLAQSTHELLLRDHRSTMDGPPRIQRFLALA